MALIRKIATLILVVAANLAFCQKEAENWYFASQCGLDFRTGDPATLTDGALKAIEGSSVISHKNTGELLFYTDGRNFWNRNHEQMQHAHALPGNCYTRISQPAIIIPSPEDESIYHVFCIRAEHESEPADPNNCTYHRDRSKLGEGESGYNLYYYRVDMRLDNGLGNVAEAESNILLQRNITGKLTAVPHTNGRDHWVIVHGWQDNVFHAYRLSAGGDIIGSVTSAIGSTHGAYGGIYFEDELMGELKASPDGTKIAAGVFSDYRPFDLFDFDASTGMLSNYVNLGDVKGQYGVSFSPDNSKLYVSSDSRDQATGCFISFSNMISTQADLRQSHPPGCA